MSILPGVDDEIFRKVFVLIRDYHAEPDWSVIGIFSTRKRAEYFKAHCERCYLDPLQIEEVVSDALLPHWMEMPEIPEDIV